MIVINDIKEKPADLYCPAGELIGTVSTDLQMNDVCLQIKRLKLTTEQSGYYFIFGNKRINILSNGRLPRHETIDADFFEIGMKQFSFLALTPPFENILDFTTNEG